MNSPFLKEFIKRNQPPVTFKSPTTKKVQTPPPKTDNNPVKERQSMREFAKSKPTGKDVEQWFRDRIEELELEED